MLYCYKDLILRIYIEIILIIIIMHCSKIRLQFVLSCFLPKQWLGGLEYEFHTYIREWVPHC